jgi:hypothetical protein
MADLTSDPLWPTHLPTSDIIRCTLTYLPTQKSDVICECSLTDKKGNGRKSTIWVNSCSLICRFIGEYLIHLLPYSIHRFWISNDNGIGFHDECFVDTTSILLQRRLYNNYSENYFMVHFSKVEILNCRWIGFFTSVFLLIGFYLQISIEVLNFYIMC